MSSNNKSNNLKCDVCEQGSVPRMDGNVCEKCQLSGWQLSDARQDMYSWELVRDEQQKLIIIMN